MKQRDQHKRLAILRLASNDHLLSDWPFMKSKLTLIVAVLAVFIVGFLLGRFQTTREFARSLEWSSYFREFHETHFLVQALQRLRGGHQAEGLDYLEARLDGSLKMLLPWMETVQSSQSDSVFFSATKAARDYRTKYPRTATDPEVQKVLSLTPLR